MTASDSTASEPIGFDSTGSSGPPEVPQPQLRALVVEDEAVTRRELADMLSALPGLAPVREAASGEEAVRLIGTEAYDAVFLDIAMPGLDGMEIARLLHLLSVPPAIVFVTASDRHAVDAFTIGAVDYLLKPIRPERLAESACRVHALRRPAASASHLVPHAPRGAVTGETGDGPPSETDPGHTGAAAGLPPHPGPTTEDPTAPPTSPAADDLPVVQIETGRQTLFIRRDDIQYAEAQGDYVRLHTEHGSHLIRLSLSHLEKIWEPAGFVRAHRGYLVAVGWVRDLRLTSSAGLLAATPAGEVPVSRRHARTVKERLLTAARDSHR